MDGSVVVEVRDRNLVVLGQLEQFRLTFSAIYTGVGSWELTVPAEHPLVEALRARGAGVRITFSGRVFSGRTRSAVVSQNPEDPPGTWIVSGISDEAALMARIVLPDPVSEPDAQQVSHYTAAGAFETVAKALVDLNAGPGALARRRLVQVAADQGRGETVLVTERFSNLLETLAKYAPLGGMGFGVTHVGAELVFDVYPVVDRSAYVRMQVITDELAEASWEYSAPAVTEVLVLGQGQGDERTVVAVTSPDAEQAADEWGLRIEEVKDQRNTDELAELEQAGQARLAEAGTETHSVKVQPIQSPQMVVGRDWWLGDLVTVVSPAGPAKAVVSQVTISYDDQGLYVQAMVGDPVGTDFESRMVAKVKETAARVDVLEREAEGGGSGGGPSGDYLPPGTIVTWGGAVAPPGWAFCYGQELSRITDATLYAAIGTTFGSGDGVTTFNAPDLRRRSVMGLDPDDPLYNTLGAAVGALTHTLTVAQMPPHTHRLTMASSENTGGFSTQQLGIGRPNSTLYTNANPVESAGGGDPFGILPPRRVMNYIIKRTQGETPADSMLAGRVGVLEGKAAALEAAPVWTTVALDSGFTHGATPLRYAELATGEVVVEGIVNGTLPVGYTTVATGVIPPELCPGVIKRRGAAFSNANGGFMEVTAAGTVVFAQQSGANRAWGQGEVRYWPGS